MLAHIPAGLDEIVHTFGSIDDPKFELENIVAFDLPYPLHYEGRKVHRSRCHRLAVDHFVRALTEVRSAELTGVLDDYSGIYMVRPIKGHPSHPSTHSWGIAIDFESLDFPLGSTDRLPQPVVEIFARSGFTYGGDFKSRKDPMHFQLASHY